MLITIVGNEVGWDSYSSLSTWWVSSILTMTFLAFIPPVKGATGEILPHYSYDNLLLHEELSELRQRQCLCPAILPEHLRMVFWCELLLLLSLASSSEPFLSFWSVKCYVRKDFLCSSSWPMLHSEIQKKRVEKSHWIILTSVTIFIDRCTYAFVTCSSLC